MNEDEIRRLNSSFEAAAKRLRATGGKAGQGAENAYAEAYQQLVKAGLKPQLRHKYRTQKG